MNFGPSPGRASVGERPTLVGGSPCALIKSSSARCYDASGNRLLQHGHSPPKPFRSRKGQSRKSRKSRKGQALYVREPMHSAYDACPFVCCFCLLSGSRLQTLDRLSRQESIVAINGVLGRILMRALAVDRRRRDQTMQMFDAPTLLDEFAGQPIKQFRMRWPSTTRAEVRGRADQSAAEMMHPNTVDKNARDQRMRAGSQPAGISQSAARRR